MDFGIFFFRLGNRLRGVFLGSTVFRIVGLASASHTPFISLHPAFRTLVSLFVAFVTFSIELLFRVHHVVLALAWITALFVLFVIS